VITILNAGNLFTIRKFVYYFVCMHVAVYVYWYVCA